MSLSRRVILRNLGVGEAGSFSGAYIAARGREALAAEMWPGSFDESQLSPPTGDEVRISSNENPLGPGPAAFQAMLDGFGDAGRYPTNARPSIRDVVNALAKKFDAEPQNITLGTGSGEILENSARAFTAPDKALITADPSYLQAVRIAERHGHPVRATELDSNLRVNLEAMAREVRGAGLVFLCNPNNPSSTVQSASAVEDFVAEVRRTSPETHILIDEAYHDYVTDSAHRTAIPLALRTPRVIVARTFSKAYGMAGLRLGYAIGDADTIRTLARWTHVFNSNNFANAAAYASLNDPKQVEQERARNKDVRDFTLKFFSDHGYDAAESQTNFIFVNIRRPAADFRSACSEHNVVVGRDFPPMAQTHARISMGTMAEMRRATEVFAQVLA